MSGLMTKETSNFASSVCGLIILPSSYASPFPKDRSKYIIYTKTVQTLQRSVLQKTFHHRCLGPPQSQVRTAAATQVRDAAALCYSQRPPPTPDLGQAPQACQRCSGYQLRQLLLAGHIKIKSISCSCFSPSSSSLKLAKFPLMLKFSRRLVLTF